jgi:hypothetical protein
MAEELGLPYKFPLNTLHSSIHGLASLARIWPTNKIWVALTGAMMAGLIANTDLFCFNRTAVVKLIEAGSLLVFNCINSHM